MGQVMGRRPKWETSVKGDKAVSLALRDRCGSTAVARGSEHWKGNQMELASPLVWSLTDCVALGKSLCLSDLSFLFHSMGRQHFAFGGVCSQEYCWVEFFKNLEGHLMALEASLRAGRFQQSLLAPHPIPSTCVFTVCSGGIS